MRHIKNDKGKTKRRKKGKGVTKLGEEEQEHENGGSEGDDATGKCAAIEILIDFRVCVQIAELAHYAVHAWIPKSMMIVKDPNTEDPNPRSNNLTFFVNNDNCIV